jgi:hypothetical protein
MDRDTTPANENSPAKGQLYTARQAAVILGCSQRSLYRWEEANLIDKPELIKVGELAVRVYSAAQVQAIRGFMQSRLPSKTKPKRSAKAHSEKKKEFTIHRRKSKRDPLKPRRKVSAKGRSDTSKRTPRAKFSAEELAMLDDAIFAEARDWVLQNGGGCVSLIPELKTGVVKKFAVPKVEDI